MIKTAIKIYFFLSVSLFAFTLKANCQICINKFSALKFSTRSYENFTKTIVAANGEIISAGKLYDYNNAGHIAKYSEKGSPIWSYTYRVNYFDFVKLLFFGGINTHDIVSTSDGGFVIAGSAEQVITVFGGPNIIIKWGLLAKIDRFGKVVWNKTLNANGDLNFTNIYQTSDGDFIAYLAADNGYKKSAGEHTYNRVLRVGPDGTVRWSTYLFTFLFDAGGLGVSNKRAITQTTNGNIVIGDVAHKTVAATGVIQEGNFHFFELDYKTGKINWEASHEFGALDNKYVPDVVSVKELAGGQLSFITSLYTNGPNGFTEKGANIITDNRGNIQNVITYSPADGSPCNIKEAAIDKSNGNRILRFNNDNSNILLSINDGGQIVWQQGYNNEQGNFPINCFATGKSGFNIFSSNNKTKQYGLMITDNTGVIDCANEPVNILASPATLDITHDSIRTDPSYEFDKYYDYGRPLIRDEDYPLTKNITCLQTLACCTDIIDSSALNAIAICEGKSYMLPDSTIVNEAGTYDVTFKTPLGCDSIVFYKIKIDKDVAKLTLGEDTCLTGQQTISLRATEGYDNYFWMNKPVSDQPTFLVNQPGKYYVNVTNVCGSKTDSIEIFDQCDYNVFMPTAFTPNGDGLNDYFRIAPINKNKLLNFSIYNRRGNLIFQTSNSAIGWDGTYKNEPQSADTFVYYLEMIGLSGNRVSQKGTFVLIR